MLINLATAKSGDIDDHYTLTHPAILLVNKMYICYAKIVIVIKRPPMTIIHTTRLFR